MKKQTVPVHVLRTCIASGITLIADTDVSISPSDYKTLDHLGKVELRVKELARSEDEAPPEPNPRDKPVAELELGDGPTKALEDVELDTLGAIADYINDAGDLESIKGIGLASEVKILDALRESGLLAADDD